MVKVAGISPVVSSAALWLLGVHLHPLRRSLFDFGHSTCQKLFEGRFARSGGRQSYACAPLDVDDSLVYGGGVGALAGVYESV
ncbi:hypothetical protein EVAR_69974_1 [Eumeta japonica]|uniref:Uncharacterized protein n=1 Tax=Eumeta variegata TaxID=151549 RepID=A0A4C1T484_EUMVA|nr:hypothetical protein EVAR_69974_1 [Eumeta japonica]